MGELSLRRPVLTMVGTVVGLVASVATGLVATAPAADAAVSGCGATVRKANGTAWRCTFADNFGGRSLNRANWLPVTTDVSAYTIGGDCYVDSPDNIRVKHGKLALTSRRLSKPITCKSPAGDYSTKYTSASLSSLGRFSQTYGRYEIRAKFPRSKVSGTHSAWWLWPSNNRYGGWPYAGEIDIAEFYSQHHDRAIPQIHYVPRNDKGVAARSNYYCKIKNPQKFHRYTLTWSATKLTISYDGKTCMQHTMQPALDAVGSLLSAGKPFDQDFTLALTQGVGAVGNRPSSKTPFPATMVIDYVRVWK